MHKPAKVRTIDPAFVAMKLKQAQNRFVSVSFLKTNGEPRTYSGQLRSASRLVGSERGQKQGAAMKERGQVWLSLPQGGSKSFYLDRVTGLTVDGETITA